jgi:Flp pilus assembly protein TadG
MKANRNSIAQSLLEFALILPMLLLLVTGFLDLGRAFFFYSSLTNASREGARSGLVMNLDNYDTDAAKKTAVDTAIKNKVLGYAFGMKALGAGDITVTITKNATTLLFEKISVNTIYCYVPITPGIISIVKTTCKGSKGIQLMATSTMWY